MTDTLNAFRNQQDKALALLNKLNEFIRQGGEFGLSLSPEMMNKLAHAISNTQQDKLKIALVGGFSEGKTSIAAAWLGKLDKSSMKISAEESSDEVKVYDIGDDCVLIDTPGLYGYKEKENDQHQIEKYKDITKKYVSESHIVLYVMNSKNPIKESHKDDVVWLFKELNLLPRTVFVLSRFDEVADVEDEQEYKEVLKIKKDNVVGRLTDFLQLNQEQINDLKIVGISANPFDEGVEYWLDNIDEFRQLSHIDTLQSATKQVVQQSGGLHQLVHETRKTIFSDVIQNEIPKVENKNQELMKAIDELTDLSEVKRRELENLSMQINSARGAAKESFKRFFNDIITQARGADMQTFSDFLDREIGEEGCIIQSQINQVFYNETMTVSTNLNNQIIKFEADLNNIDSAVSVMARKGVNHLVKNVKLDNTTVLAARDGLKSIGSMVGLDLAKSLKFKPYGAIKLADKLNGAFAMLGIGLEIYDSYKQAEMQEKFERAKAELIDNIKTQQKEILTLLDSPDFIKMFFQGYLDLESAVKKLQEQRFNQEEQNQRFSEWKKQGEIIEAEFKELN